MLCLVSAARCNRLMPAMENPFSNFGQPVVPAFPAQQAYDSAAVYSIPLLPQPPPPKWASSKSLQGKRGGFNSKNNFRMPSTKVNINKIRKQNAQGSRRHFGSGPKLCYLQHICQVFAEGHQPLPSGLLACRSKGRACQRPTSCALPSGWLLQ